MKVIQLRGTNGVGKTTAVREYMRNGQFWTESVEMGGSQYIYHFSGSVAIIGKYDGETATGGIDGYITNKDELKNLIVRILKRVKPQTLIFECVFYGVSYQFSYDIKTVVERMGYEYVALCLMPPFDVSLERIWGRNGSKDINVEARQSVYRQAIVSNSKLRAKGVNVKVIDTSKIPKEDMGKIIAEEI